MGKTAYLLMACKITTQWPFIDVMGLGIFSEVSPTTTLRDFFYVELWHSSANDFSEAREGCREYAAVKFGQDRAVTLLDHNRG